MPLRTLFFFFFFFNDTATTEIYTLSLHDALPICYLLTAPFGPRPIHVATVGDPLDRKSTRLNSSHGYISYAVFCLKKKNKTSQRTRATPWEQSYRDSCRLHSHARFPLNAACTHHS